MPALPVYLPDISSPRHPATTAVTGTTRTATAPAITTPSPSSNVAPRIYAPATHAAGAQPRHGQDLRSPRRCSSPFTTAGSFLTAVSGNALAWPPMPPPPTTAAPPRPLRDEAAERRGSASVTGVDGDVDTPLRRMPRCLPCTAAAGEPDKSGRGFSCVASGIHLSTMTTHTTTATTTTTTSLPFTPGISTSTAPPAVGGHSGISAGPARLFSPNSRDFAASLMQLHWAGGSFESASACVSQLHGGSGCGAAELGGSSLTSAFGLRLVGEDAEWLQPCRGDGPDTAAAGVHASGVGETRPCPPPFAHSRTSPLSSAVDVFTVASAVTHAAAPSSASAPVSSASTAASATGVPHPAAPVKGAAGRAYARLERAVQRTRAGAYDSRQSAAALTDDEDSYASAMMWAAEKLATAL